MYQNALPIYKIKYFNNSNSFLYLVNFFSRFFHIAVVFDFVFLYSTLVLILESDGKKCEVYFFIYDYLYVIQIDLKWDIDTAIFSIIFRFFCKFCLNRDIIHLITIIQIVASYQSVARSGREKGTKIKKDK